MNVLLIIAGIVGALCGAGLTALLGKNRVVGATVGLIIALVMAVFIIPLMAHPPRCQYGDPIDYPRKERPAGYVYVIQDTEFSKFYKIGLTNLPSQRIGDIRQILPGASEIVAIIESNDAPALESQLHRRYAESRKRGEWFALSDSQVREICHI